MNGHTTTNIFLWISHLQLFYRNTEGADDQV